MLVQELITDPLVPVCFEIADGIFNSFIFQILQRVSRCTSVRLVK